MVPLSIMSVFGIETIFLSKSSHRFRQWQAKFLKSSYVLPVIRNSRFVKKHQPLLLLMIFALVASNAVSVYPSFVSLNAAYEEFTDEDMAVLHWMQYHLNNSTTVIASDHRLARMAEALGLNTTLDEASLIWTAENLTEYWNELKGINKNYSQITHIIIDDIMREHVVHVYFGNMQYMTNASYDKFSSPFFTLVYRNETVDSNGVAVHWSEIYEVNWSFIENQGAGG